VSADTADDLEAYEDLAGLLVTALRAAKPCLPAISVPVEVRSQIKVALDAYETFCRPTCGWRDNGECAEGDCCGCPCGHGENEEAP